MDTKGNSKAAQGKVPEVKVVGQIDLDGINEATRPRKKTKEERAEMRQMKKEEQEAYNRDFAIRSLEEKRDRLQQDIRSATKQANDLLASITEVREAGAKERREKETRLAYLREKQAVRERYLAAPITNDERQRDLQLFGIRPKKMDVVHFHVPKTATAEEMDGVALVRDENHYYIAIDLYDQPDQEDNATTLMDENPDGTFEGIWPRHTCLKPAAKFEERFVRNLTDKYADDLGKAEEFIEGVCRQEKEEIGRLTEALETCREAGESADEAERTLEELKKRIKQMNADLLATDADLRRHRQETREEQEVDAAAVTPLLDFGTDETELEPIDGLDLDTPTEKKYLHLPYTRGHRQMTTMNWPRIETTYEGWLRFRLMGNIARLVYMLRKAHALTYVLTEEYYGELSKRGREYYKGMKVDDVVPSGESAAGAIVYPSQGYQDTVLYRIDNRSQLGIIVVYIREDRLMFYESYSMQEVINRPRTDHFMCQSMKESGTDPSRLFSWIRNIVVSHLAMEHDMERCVRRLIEEDKGVATETDIREDDAVDATDDRDVVVRDYTWYTDITVNREIPVRGYVSHRWFGSGKDKVIREVWVRPHVKHGYHRSAGARKGG